MLIDYQELSEQALQAIAERHVIAQMVDWEEEPKLKEWSAKVVAKIRSGELVIAYSELDESVQVKLATDINWTNS